MRFYFARKSGRDFTENLIRMNKEEAKKVLTKVINKYRLKSYNELIQFVDNSKWIVENAESGEEYQIQIQTIVDDEENRNIRCIFSINEGGILSFMFPISGDFIKNSDDEFVGE